VDGRDKPGHDKRQTKEQIMPDALELLKTRRSLKPIEMTGPGPSAAEIETILIIGSRVPDHGKLSPWRFIVFEGDGRTRAGEIFAKLFAQKNPQATPDQIEKERARFSQAPLVIAVVSKTVEHFKVPAWEQELSAGAAAMNIIHAATALGYVCDWVTGWLAFDRDVMDALGLAPNEKIAGFIHIGKATRTIEDRPRPPLSEIVTRF
jgi:nitroreductase